MTTPISPRDRLTEAGINYSIAALLPVLLSFIVVMIFQPAMGDGYQDSNVYKYCAYLIPQLCFAVAALIYFRRTKTPAREVYAPCRWQYFLLALLLAFGLFSLSWVNGLFIGFIGQFGYKQAASSLPDVSGWYLLPALLVIAVLPAVFEETIFRGIQVYATRREGWGMSAVIFISGALFALFHGNPEQTIYQFACGACYALLAIRSKSAYPTMLAHFANNAAILVLTACGMTDFPEAIKPYFYALAGVCFIGVLVYLIFFAREQLGEAKAHKKGKYFLGAAVGIALCAVEWIALFLQGIGL